MRVFLGKRVLLAALACSRSSPLVVIPPDLGSPFRPVFCSTIQLRHHLLKRRDKRLLSQERESHGVSYGLNLSLAGRGIIVNDKVFHNMMSADLQKHGARTVGNLSGFQILIRGDVLGRSSKISKSQFGKLLKQVTSHISSVPKIFIQDGAVGLSTKCGAKARVISDCPSAALSFSRVLWKIPDRAVSHDSSPLTVYIAASISLKTGENIGLGSEMSNGFIAVDVGRSSLVLCGKAFADVDGVKAALTALALPVILARGGLPLSARALLFGNSVVLLFASKETMKLSFADMQKNLTSADAGILLSSEGISPLFSLEGGCSPILSEKLAALIFCSADSSGVLPGAAKLYPGQAVYHFLAGYQDGKFLPAYFSGPSPISPLDLAKALFSRVGDHSDHLEYTDVPSFLVNVYREGEHLSGKDLVKVIESTLTGEITERWVGPTSDPRVGDLKGKYKGFLSSEFPEIPEEFTF